MIKGKDLLIEKLYYDVFKPHGLSSREKLYKECKTKNNSITRNDVKNFLSSNDIYTQHYPVRKKERKKERNIFILPKKTYYIEISTIHYSNKTKNKLYKLI